MTAWLVASLAGWLATGGSAMVEPATTSGVTAPSAPQKDETSAVAAYTVVNLGLVVSLDRTSLVLGIDQEVTMHVDLPEDALGTLGRVSIKTSVGEIIDMTRDSARRVSARWVLPARRFPQGAIVLADTDDETPRRGAVFVPLPAVASPLFRTDANAEVTIRVAGQLFGPKRANSAGEVRVPVVVPPGVDIAVALSKNDHGKTAEETVDLAHPPFPRVLLSTPASATRGKPTDVWAFGIDAGARPLRPGTMSMQTVQDDDAAAVWAQPVDAGPGWTHFLIFPPPRTVSDRLALRAFDEAAHAIANAKATTPSARATAEIALQPGPAARLIMIPNRVHMTVGSSQTLVVVVRAEDAFGNPTTAEGTKFFVDGAAAPNVTSLDGPVRVVVPAPRASVRSDRMRIEAIGDNTYAVHEVLLEGVMRPPSPRVAISDAEHTGSLTVKAAMVWNTDAGGGGAGSLDGAFAFRRFAAWPQHLFVSATAAYLQRSMTFASPENVARLDIHTVPLLLGALWRVKPARGVGIFLGIAAGAARIDLQTTTIGATITGGAWVPALRVSADLALGAGAYQMVIGTSHSEIPGTRLSSQDNLRGNLGGWELGIGARRRW